MNTVFTPRLTAGAPSSRLGSKATSLKRRHPASAASCDAPEAEKEAAALALQHLRSGKAVRAGNEGEASEGSGEGPSEKASGGRRKAHGMGVVQKVRGS